MQRRVVPICLFLLLCAALLTAQSNSSSATQQPAANVQGQSATQSQPATNVASDDKSPKDDFERSHKTHVRLGTISVGAGYSRFSGPLFFSPFWRYGFYPYSPYFYGPYSVAYAPFFYDPFYGPSFVPYARGFAYGPDKGELRLSANPKSAQVFVDGAYAGTADHLKNMWLDSGAYEVSVSAPGREPFHQRIYILSGKSLKIDARLGPQKEKPQTEEKP
jgi:hypothetical protein